MKLIVGLGNPGLIYSGSRHNIGFMAVKALARSQKIRWRKDKAAAALTVPGRLSSEKILLALPLTFMNLSGIAVKALLEKYKIGLQDLLVVCDDLDLELGRLRIRPAGSCGGHRGLESVMNALASDNFSRLRIGIGRPRKSAMDAGRYVLSRFSRKESKVVREAIASALDCCRTWGLQGSTQAMNLFNGFSKV